MAGGAFFSDGSDGLQLTKNVKDIFVVGLLIQRVNLREHDLSLLIDNEHRTLVDAGDRIALAEHAKLLGGCAVWVKIATQRVLQFPDVSLLPCNMAWY